jgi:hypothetical protein
MRDIITIEPKLSGDKNGNLTLDLAYKIEEVALRTSFILEVLKMSEADQEKPMCFKSQLGKITFTHQIGFSPYITDSMKHLEMARETACCFINRIMGKECEEPKLTIVENSRKDSTVLEETILNEVIIIHKDRTIMIEGMVNILEKSIDKFPFLQILHYMDSIMHRSEYIDNLKVNVLVTQMILAKTNLRLELKRCRKNV